MCWAAKSLHQMAVAAERVVDAFGIPYSEDGVHPAGKHIDIIRRISHRATAFIRELPKISDFTDGAVDYRAHEVLKHSLKLLAAAIRPRRGDRPLLWQWANGEGRWAIAELRTSKQEADDALIRHMAATRRRQRTAAVKWARRASIGESHAATKSRDTSLSFSASADKGHRGESSPQAAADKGLAEWSRDWGAGTTDTAGEILKTLEAIDVVERDHSEIALPALVGSELKRMGSLFKWCTAVGADGTRLRHLTYASSGALGALAAIMATIEGLRRWPAAVRVVIAAAIPKKLGGGVATHRDCDDGVSALGTHEIPPLRRDP